MRVRFRDLSGEERALICNGCGPKGSVATVRLGPLVVSVGVDPPDWLFGASCDHHDFNYWLGGDEAARLKADRQFLESMLRAADRTPWWYPRPLARLRAWTYYAAVRLGGAGSFRLGPERTREDLEREVAALRALEG